MTRTTRRLTAAACSAALLLVPTACGGGDSRTTSTPPLSVADFKAQADAACAASNSDVEKIQSEFDVSSTDKARAAVTALADRVDKLVSDLRALRAPTDLQPDVDAMLDEVSTVTVNARRQGGLFLHAPTSPFAKADRMAIALGLPQCAGTDSSTPSPGPTTLTVSQLRAQATGICRAANAEIDLFKPGKNPTSDELANSYRALATLLLAEIDYLKVLKPPASLATRYKALVDSLTLTANTINDSGAGTATLDIDPFIDPIAKSRAVGLPICGRG